jgi:N-acetyl sugar amidotransferase
MPEYQLCTKCVMDTSAPNIVFDDRGICNYCTDFSKSLTDTKFIQKLSEQDNFLDLVKQSGKGKDYDCIVGVSGGVDSSYSLYLAVKHGLRPLAVHLDNGWNSELAVSNITNLVTKLNVDLYTHVIDWEENRDLQLSFFKANVIDIELLMDNAMTALNYQQAAKFGLKYILAGTNTSTEGMGMPKGWSHFKYDAKNIRSIHQEFGNLPIKTHPLFSSLDFIQYKFIRGIKWISFLDYFSYNKFEAVEILQKEMEYKPYPYKHYESVFTRFYQGYILPSKFGVDKRRVHLSTLVISDQMMREEALKFLEQQPYSDPKSCSNDRIFVMKKLGFTETEFDNYLKSPAIPHEYYGSETNLLKSLVGVYQFIKAKTKLVRSIE